MDRRTNESWAWASYTRSFSIASPKAYTQYRLVLTPAGPEERDVTIGLSNDTMAEVRQGLAEGEQVVRHPYKFLSDADKFRLYGPSGGPKGGDWAGKGGKGKGGPGKGPNGKGPPGGPDNGGPPPEGPGKEGKGRPMGNMP